MVADIFNFPTSPPNMAGRHEPIGLKNCFSLTRQHHFQVQSIFKNKMSKSCCGVQLVCVCADVCKYCGLSSSYKLHQKQEQSCTKILLTSVTVLINYPLCSTTCPLINFHFLKLHSGAHWVIAGFFHLIFGRPRSKADPPAG